MEFSVCMLSAAAIILGLDLTTIIISQLHVLVTNTQPFLSVIFRVTQSKPAGLQNPASSAAEKRKEKEKTKER